MNEGVIDLVTGITFHGGGESVTIPVDTFRRLCERHTEVGWLKERNAKLEEGLVMAFVQGARWWEFQVSEGGATMWQSDQDAAWSEGERRLHNGTLGRKPPFPPDKDTP